jgi:hypothetical protein
MLAPALVLLVLPPLVVDASARPSGRQLISRKAPPPGLGVWTEVNGGAGGAADTDHDPWLLKPRFHIGAPNPAGCAGSGFCGGCNDVNAIFRFQNVTHVFYQHTLSPPYAADKPPDGTDYRVCWAHSASSDLIKWRNWGCIGDWDQIYYVAFDGAMLGLDPSTGAPTILFDGLQKGSNFSSQPPPTFVEVFARPKNASDPWLREWDVQPSEAPAWTSTVTGTNPSPGFKIGASEGGNATLTYTVAASHASGRCSLLASATMHGSLELINADFFFPGKDGPHCAQPNLIRLPRANLHSGSPSDRAKYLLKFEGRGSVYLTGSVGNNNMQPSRRINFQPNTGTVLRSFDFGNFQWAELMAPSEQDPVRGLLLGWVRSGQWVSGVHPPFALGSPCNPDWPSAPPAFMTESLLREVLWDEQSQQVITPPLRELKKLRGQQPLATLGQTQLRAGERLPILTSHLRGSTTVGRQVEIHAYFTRPVGKATGHTFGFSVLESRQLQQQTDVFFTGMAGDNVELTIDATRSGFLPSFCTKLLPPSHVSGQVSLLTEEEVLDLRIFVDRGIVEAFAMGGRGVATVSVRPNATSTGVSVISGSNITLLNLTIWALGTIWEEPGEFQNER